MIPYMTSDDPTQQDKQIPSSARRYQLHEVTLQTLEEVIEAAFLKDNTVINFKMLEVVLLVLAKSLRVLDRKVVLELPDVQGSGPNSNISLREVRVRTRLNTANGKRKKSASNILSSKAPKAKKTKETGAARHIHQIFPTTSQQAIKTAEKLPQVTVRGRQTEGFSSVSVGSSNRSLKKNLIDKANDPYKHQKSEKSELIRQIYHPMSNVGDNVIKVASLQGESQGDVKSSYEWKTSELGMYPNITTSRRGYSTTDESLVQTIGSRNLLSDTSCEAGAKATVTEKKTKPSKPRPQKKKPETEKIIIVEFPSENFEPPFIYETERKYLPESMVTTDRLKKLTQEVSQLEEKFSHFAPTEGYELLEILHKRSSMSSPVSMLQLSAKLEAVESTSHKLYDILQNWMANRKTIDETPTILEDVSSLVWEPTREKRFAFPLEPVITCYARMDLTKQEKRDPSEQSFTYVRGSLGKDKAMKNVIHYELRKYCNGLRKEMTNAVHSHAYYIRNVGDKAIQNGRDLSKRLKDLLLSTDKIDVLETQASHFSEKFDALDAKISQEMSNCQEELTIMQHHTATACDNLAEFIMNMKLDTKDVEELHMKFNIFHYNLDGTSEIQDDIKIEQQNLASEISVLWNNYRRIHKDKYDRINLNEALASKAGLEVFNSFTTFDNYYAVFGHIQSVIERCLSEVHCTEIMWQRHIDELFKNACNKADICYIQAAKEDFDNNAAHLHSKLDFMFSIARKEQEPPKVKKHEKPCLACGAQPNFPRKAKDSEAPRPSKDDSQEEERAEICYFSRPIPRNHQCPLPCGRYYKAPTLEENIVVTKVPTINTDNACKKDDQKPKEDDQKPNEDNEYQKMVPCLPCSNYYQPRIIRISKMPKRYINATRERVQVPCAPGKGAKNVPGAVEEENSAESHKALYKNVDYY